MVEGMSVYSAASNIRDIDVDAIISKATEIAVQLNVLEKREDAAPLLEVYSDPIDPEEFQKYIEDGDKYVQQNN